MLNISKSSVQLKYGTVMLKYYNKFNGVDVFLALIYKLYAILNIKTRLFKYATKKKRVLM